MQKFYDVFDEASQTAIIFAYTFQNISAYSALFAMR